MHFRSFPARLLRHVVTSGLVITSVTPVHAQLFVGGDQATGVGIPGGSFSPNSATARRQFLQAAGNSISTENFEGYKPGLTAKLRSAIVRYADQSASLA
nr:hypothetical protein [Gemmatimonadaceae bacterium]